MEPPSYPPYDFWYQPHDLLSSKIEEPLEHRASHTPSELSDDLGMTASNGNPTQIASKLATKDSDRLPNTLTDRSLLMRGTSLPPHDSDTVDLGPTLPLPVRRARAKKNRSFA